MPTGVNLLDWRAHRERQLQRRFLMLMGALVASGLGAMFIAAHTLTDQIDAERARHEPLARETEEGTAALTELDRLERSVRALKDHLAAIQALEATRQQRLTAIETVLSTRPAPITLDRLSSTQDGLLITGTTRSSEAISAYTDSLTASTVVTAARITKLRGISNRPIAQSHFELVAEVPWR